MWYGVKLSFVVEVAEVHGVEVGGKGEVGGSGAGINGGGGGCGGGGGTAEEYLKWIPVVLDPKEHQAFEWATEARVKNGFKEWPYGCEQPEERTVTPDDRLKERMLEAFGIVKASRGVSG